MDENKELISNSEAGVNGEEKNTDVQLVQLVNNRDHFLQTLVHITNLSAEEKLIPITLQMGGLLISGLMIAGDVYFRMFADIYTSVNASPEARQFIVEHGDQYRETRNNDSGPDDNIAYIHLKECVVISNHKKSTYTTLWRGLISRVDGFFLGYFEPVSKPVSDVVSEPAA